ncbi:Calx-beta domain-containing protein [uncultured Aquimonas sp.]|uniref:Calx-beta domain-containing protein n=1 Tax=uncultured Aquimonas sp. TaxID=385483 RepID=UPI000869A948|nr:Calx-beta domain-containing protein [uncultured Aquimonas sp.]ODU42478.1 MAG: hypothetical protein ABS96_27205 [Xanthomonadaceae bacterium SCN 69-123]
MAGRSLYPALMWASATLLGLTPAETWAGGACGSDDPTWVLAAPAAPARVPGGVVQPHEIYVACPEPDILLPLAAAAAAGASIDALAPDRTDPNGDSVLVSFDRQIGNFRPADVLRCRVGGSSPGNDCTRVFDSAARGIPTHVNVIGLDQYFLANPQSGGTSQLALAFDQTFRIGQQVLRPQRLYRFAQNSGAAPLEVLADSDYGLDRATGFADHSVHWGGGTVRGLAPTRWSRSSGGGLVVGPGQVALQNAFFHRVDRVFDFASIDPSWRSVGLAGLGTQNGGRASFNADTLTVAENAGSVSLPVRRIFASGQAHQNAQGFIRYSVVLVDGSARAGVDFAFAPPQLVQFDHAGITDGSVGFSLIDNALADGNRQFTVRMTPISAFAAPGQFMEVQVTIVDDEGGGDSIFANGFE